MVLVVTESAGFQMKDMLKADGRQNVAVRFAVHGGGCSGLSYGLGFDTEVGPDDETFEFQGVPFVIAKEALGVVAGVQIDYKQSMMGGGFTITNPNAIATCGCGMSFKTATNEGTPEKCDD
ncbi:MAG: HesB/IscA family protein [Bacilli bacterium]